MIYRGFKEDIQEEDIQESIYKEEYIEEIQKIYRRYIGEYIERRNIEQKQKIYRKIIGDNVKISVLWSIKDYGREGRRKKKRRKKREGRPVGHRIVYAQLIYMIMTFVLYLCIW